ncbi:MAG: serine protease [Nitrospirales bacterium]
MLHAANKFGFHAAEAHFHAKYYSKHLKPGRGKPSYKKVLRGKIDFVGMIRGKLDPLYLSLIRKLQVLDPTLVRKLPSPSWIDEIKSALFIIDVEFSNGDVSQGTGFFLKGIGLVTCAHVIKASVKTEIYQGYNPSKKYGVKSVVTDDAIDIAVLTIDGFSGGELALEDDGAAREDSEILLAGYPDFAPGNSGAIERGRIVATYRYMDHKRFLIDARIVPGNSGGPVLDNKRRVIGIAAKGDGGPNSVIPISAVKDGLIAKPGTP